MNNNILLESGTGELEVIEFVANNNKYAINVVKVKEIIEMPYDTLTQLPDPKQEIAGLILWSDEIITLIDLKYILTKRSTTKLGKKVIICEFNNIKVAFNIDDVVGVHRIGSVSYTHLDVYKRQSIWEPLKNITRIFNGEDAETVAKDIEQGVKDGIDMSK